MKKRVTIPMSDGLVKAALINALKNTESLMNVVNDNLLGNGTKEELNNMHFDYLGLIGIFSGDYKVTIEIEENDMHTFSGKHGVDFPPFINLEVVDVEEQVAQAEEENDKPQYFEHLVYIEDGELVVAIRSDKPFEGSTCEDDTDMPHYRYQNVEQGQSLIVEGTPYVVAADSTRMSWTILKDGEVVDEVSE